MDVVIEVVADVEVVTVDEVVVVDLPARENAAPTPAMMITTTITITTIALLTPDLSNFISGRFASNNFRAVGTYLNISEMFTLELLSVIPHPI